jgi:DNA-binding CsgD family transcriptional regulator
MEERPVRLAPRQRQVLALTARGLTTREIAKELGIAYKTVENTRYEVCNALGARNAPHAVMLGVEHGLIQARTLTPGRRVAPTMQWTRENYD